MRDRTPSHTEGSTPALIKFCEGKLTDAQARIAILENGTLQDFKPEAK